MSNAINDYTQDWNGGGTFKAHMTRLLTTANDGDPENAIGSGDWSSGSYIVQYGIDGDTNGPATTCYSVDTVGNIVARLAVTAGGTITGNALVSTTFVSAASVTATGAVQGATVSSTSGDVTSANDVVATGNLTTAAGSVLAPTIGQANTAFTGTSVTVTGNVIASGSGSVIQASNNGTVSGTIVSADDVRWKLNLTADPVLSGQGAVAWVSDGSDTGSDGDFLIKTRDAAGTPGSERIVNISEGTPVGEILMWATDTPPAGYMICDGRAISQTTYSALFAILGLTYGNPGGGDFNIPDYRGVFMRGTDNPNTAEGAAGIDPDAATRTDRGDGTTGNNVGTRQPHALEEHQHNVSDNATDVGTNSAALDGPGNVAVPSGNVISVSGNTSAETRPVNVYINFIIKVQ